MLMSVFRRSRADVIAVMEARQKKRLSELYPSQLSGKKLVVLRVPDRFAYMDPALVALLRERLRQLPELGNWRDGPFSLTEGSR